MVLNVLNFYCGTIGKIGTFGKIETTKILI
jgi:hypothetical protein